MKGFPPLGGTWDMGDVPGGRVRRVYPRLLHPEDVPVAEGTRCLGVGTVAKSW